jgi:hypothetical protein
MIVKNNYWSDSLGNYGGSSNPDSIKIDTCSGSPTFQHKFAKRMFVVNFPRNFFLFDHVLDTNEVKGVSDIDSSHLSTLNRFLGLQDTFGIIYFKGLPLKESDSLFMLNPSVLMYFQDYQDVNYITEHFTLTIDSVHVVEFISGYGTGCIVPKDKAMESNNPITDIFPSTFWPRNWRPKGYQGYLYDIFCPMAWELTYGSRSVVIHNEDLWEGGDGLTTGIITHPDVSSGTSPK